MKAGSAGLTCAAPLSGSLSSNPTNKPWTAGKGLPLCASVYPMENEDDSMGRL